MVRFRRVLLIALMGALAAAFALRLHQLGVQSLWYDEAVSVYLASKSLGALVAHTARDIHPPLYYILLHIWTGLAGQSEFAAAYLSLWWGMLLVASGVTFARWLGGPQVALVTAGLLTLSPFNIWYSQEVRMYTLGAALGLWTLMALWQLLCAPRLKKRWIFLWVTSAAAGLYTLYYFAFLLLWEALFVAWWLRRTGASRRRWQSWALIGGSALLLWLPWLPVAARQALDPPVPPWREGKPLVGALIEGLGALALGQSVEYHTIWPMIALLAPVVGIGLWLRWRQKQNPGLPLLLGALGLPLAILLLSTYTPAPLYHVRYLFTYSPAFYILLSMAFTGWASEAYRRAWFPGGILASFLLIAPLLILSGESLQRYWNDTRYAADDLREGVNQVERGWREGDVLLVNAGYAYPAINLYLDDPIAWQGRLTQWEGQPENPGLPVLQSGSIGGDPSLGWGLPESDFYATTPQETVAALERIAEQAPRLWQFRIYDTVTDPEGLIRNWLEQHALLFHDQLLSGESNARVQGWYFPPAPGSGPARTIATQFLAPDSNESWITLLGVDPPAEPSAGGGWVDLTLWLEGSPQMDPSLRLSLGLFDTSKANRQWAVTDEQPFGPLLSLRELEGPQRWPVRLRLPRGLPPGKYNALLKFYRPSDGTVLAGMGPQMENREQLRVAVVEVGPTPPSDVPPRIGTRHEVTFGPVKLLGYEVPPGPWEPGASIPIELVWRLVEPVEEELRPFVTSDALLQDDGGVTNEYPPLQWRPGEVVRDIHYVTVAPDAAPGEYPLYLRVSEGATTIPWQEGFFEAGETLPIGQITIQDRPRSFEPPEISTPLDVAFGESIELIGATLPDGPLRPGEDLPLTLNWYATNRPTARYKIFTHLIGADGTLVAQRDLEPGDGRLPTSGWARGEYITTQFPIPLPPDVPAGRYELRVGLYDPVTNERVPPFGANVNGEANYLVLGGVEVQAP